MTEQMGWRVEEAPDRILGGRSGERPDFYRTLSDPTPSGGAEGGSLDEALVRSESFKLWMGRFSQGASPQSHGPAMSDAVVIRAALSEIVGGGFRTSGARMLITSADASAGQLSSGR